VPVIIQSFDKEFLKEIGKELSVPIVQLYRTGEPMVNLNEVAKYADVVSPNIIDLQLSFSS
jgi:glycerophosphoryl diester phosphodiesterase